MTERKLTEQQECIYSYIKKIILDWGYPDNVKFKYELLTFPSWVTDSPVYKLGDSYYTHIKLRKRLIR